MKTKVSASEKRTNIQDINQVVQSILCLKRITGHGFTKSNKDDSALVSDFDVDQTTEEKDGSSFLKEESVVSSKDVKRVGPAYFAGNVATVASTCPVCLKPITSGAVSGNYRSLFTLTSTG